MQTVTVMKKNKFLLSFEKILATILGLKRFYRVNFAFNVFIRIPFFNYYY